MAAINAALEAIASLDLGKKVNYTQIAKEFGVDRSTLSRRARGVTHSYVKKHQNQPNLNLHKRGALYNILRVSALEGYRLLAKWYENLRRK